MKRALKWIVSILSEADGTGSSSRVAMMLVILSVAATLCFYVFKTKTFPDGTVILALSSLVTAAASIYAANAWKNKPSDAAPVVPAPDNPDKGVIQP